MAGEGDIETTVVKVLAKVCVAGGAAAVGGIPAAVKESKDRVGTALRNSGYRWPGDRAGGRRLGAARPHLGLGPGVGGGAPFDLDTNIDTLLSPKSDGEHRGVLPLPLVVFIEPGA